jgi:hypothetical protein
MAEQITAWSTFGLVLVTLAALGISFWSVRKQVESFRESVAEMRKQTTSFAESAAAMRSQAESFALSVSASLSFKLSDHFDSPDFRKLRSKAATALVTNQDLENADDVFDFFETVGLYVRRRALDEETAHALFFHWVNIYWHAGQDCILRNQKRTVSVWSDFQDLHRTLLEIERKQDRNSRDINPTPSDITYFLNQEREELGDG